MDIVLLKELYKLKLSAKWMELNLIASWRDLAVTQHIPKDLYIEIGSSNTSHEPFFYTSLHLCPNLVHWNFDLFISCLSSFFGWRCGFDGDRPMNQIKVQILDSQFLKGSSTSGFDVFNFVPPNLGYNK